MKLWFVLGGWPTNADFSPLQIDLFLSRHIGWTQWSTWRPCEVVQCGKATTSRIRLCRSKYPELCPGEAVEEIDCPNSRQLAPCGCYDESQKPAYLGYATKTVSGRVCQPWAFQFPHRHSRTPLHFPHAHLERNYCRNPDPSEEDQGRPWCYTSDPNVTWEYCDVDPCDSNVAAKVSDQKNDTNFMQQLITLIETRKSMCTHNCVNGQCNKGTCVCSPGFFGARCDQCSCMALENAASCDVNTGQCSCKPGWRGNKCDIATCSFSCGKNGKCVESNRSMFRGRNAPPVSSSFVVGATMKTSVNSNCGVTDKSHHAMCLVNEKEHFVDVSNGVPSWCKIAKCPPETPQLCASNTCAEECTWRGGSVAECPLVRVIEKGRSQARTVWNSLWDRRRRRRSNSSYEFYCKCKKGYIGDKCLVPKHQACETCGTNEVCDKETAQCTCASGWSRGINELNGTCTEPDITQLGPCEWSPSQWLRSDSMFLDCRLETSLQLPTTILNSVVPPAGTRMIRVALGSGQKVRKQDMFRIINSARETLEKLYLKNVHFLNDTRLVLETPVNLKSGLFID